MRKLCLYLAVTLTVSVSSTTLFPAGEPAYRDGIFEGVSSDSPFGRVRLEIVIERGRITDLVYKEIPDWYPERVKEGMKKQIIDRQTLRLNAVTGATVTCGLVTEAVSRALKKAAPLPVVSPTPPQQNVPPRVILETNQGKIELVLYPEKAPRAVENFIGLVEKGYYDGIIFHRIIPGFMIQGGDPTGTGRGGASLWGKPFKDEFSPDLRFDRPGLLAMANAGPNTNGSQFFITVAATPWLNNRHTIFGEVIDGYDVVQAIEKTRTGPRDRLADDQKILKAYIKTGK